MNTETPLPRETISVPHHYKMHDQPRAENAEHRTSTGQVTWSEIARRGTTVPVKENNGKLLLARGILRHRSTPHSRRNSS